MVKNKTNNVYLRINQINNVLDVTTDYMNNIIIYIHVICDVTEFNYAIEIV